MQEAVTDLKARTKCSDTTYDKLGNNSIVKDSPLFFFPPQDETDGSLTPCAFGLRLCSGARIQTVRKSKTIEEIHSEVVTHVILLITVNKYRNILMYPWELLIFCSLETTVAVQTGIMSLLKHREATLDVLIYSFK